MKEERCASAASNDGLHTTATLRLREGQSLVYEVRFASPVESSAPSTAPRATAPVEPAPAPSADTPTSRWAGYGLVGLAVVGLAAGSYFELRANSLAGEFKPNCNSNGECLTSDRDKGARAQRFATLSTVSFAAAGAAAVGGTILLFRASGDVGRAVSSATRFDLAMSGAF